MFSFKENEIDILLIEVDGVNYFKINLKQGAISKNDKIQANIFSNNLLNLNNLESALNQIISQYQIQEFGIILHLPNVLFTKVDLVKVANPREAIFNYLQTNFPLPLNNYTFFFKEISYQKNVNLISFNVYLINKDLIERLLLISQRYNLIPLFITFSAEVFYHYILNKTLIDFYGNYFIFFLDEHILMLLLIKNLMIEKLILEEISPEININQLLLRFYNSLMINFKEDYKVLLFTQKEINLPAEITQQKLIFDLKPQEMFLEGSEILFKKIFSDEEFADFLPIKPYSAYFLRRVPTILNLLSIYLLCLIIVFGSFYLLADFQLKKEEKNLASQIIDIKKITSENKIKTFFDLTKSLDLGFLSRFQLLNQIKNLEGFEKVDFTQDRIIFSLKISRVQEQNIKNNVQFLLPQAILVNQEIIGNEVRLTYQF